MEQAKAVGASWARSFLAAGIATYLAVGWDAPAIVNAALAYNVWAQDSGVYVDNGGGLYVFVN